MKIDAGKKYTAREAAALLDSTEETIKKYCRSGKLQGKQVGPKKRWHILGSTILRQRKAWNLD